jgi:NDP-sugar pyrophosphorylase family protein
VPENSEEKKKDAEAQAAEDERTDIFDLRRSAAPKRFFRHDATCSRRSREHKPVITQAFVLAAGLGTRLRPLTADLPKPLVPIWQKRLVTFALDHLIAAGVEKLHLNTHHCAECFDKTFPDATYRDRELRFHHEPELLETAGGIANIVDAIEPAALLVYNADVLTDLPLAALVEAHFSDKNLVTLALRSGGALRDIALAPDSRRVTGIRNQIGTDHKFGFTGVYILSFDFVQRFERGVKRSVIPHFVDAIRKGEQIGGVVIEEGNWWEVGTPAAYVRLHRELRGRERFPSYPVDEPAWRDSIHPAAKVAVDAIIEGCSVVGENAVVGAGAVVRDTIVWPGAQIASRSELQDCIVRMRQRAEGILQNAIV